VTYFYRIKASNGCSTSLVSNTITVGTTAPVAPTATDANNFTCNSFNANWGAVAGATSYILEVSTTASFSNYQGTYNNLNVGNVTTLNVTGLTTGVTYFYRIKATNGCSNSLVSNTITVSTTAPVAPTATDPNNFTCNSFNANWGAVTGATQYFLDVSTTSAFTAGTFVSGYNNLNVGNVTTLNVTGLTTGVVYFYRIRASNGCSTSLNSNTITVSTTAPVSPTATPATNFSCTSFNANWGAVSGATQYIIEVSTSASFTSYVGTYNNLNVGNVTTLNVTGLTSNTTYFYRIKSTNGCSTSLPSNTITVSTSAPIAPIAAAASNFTCTSFNANWGAVTGATQYFVDVSTDANFATFQGTYNNVNVGNVTTYFVTGLTVNTTYYYRVRADNGCTFSANSNTINVTTTSPVAPIALNADNFSCTTFNANWSASVGATSYELDVSTSGSFANFVSGFSAFNVGNVTTYNVTNLTQNMTYYYRIRAVNGCATSGNSNIVVVTIAAPVAPNGIDASNITCTSLNANWGVSSGATGYYLDVSTTANFAAGTFVTPYNNAFVGNTNTYNIIGLTQGITYYYRVRAINGCATSVNSNTVTASTTAPTAPIALNGSNFTCTSFNANWSPVLGAVAYYLDVSTDPGFGSFVSGYNNINVGTANTYPITGLAQNANYYYRVRAANICSTSTSSNSTLVTTSAPIAPTSSGSSNLTCTSFNANWGATVGATAYYLDVATDANFGASILPGYNNLSIGNVTTYNVTGLTVNSTYYYRVRAGNGCSISLNSNSIMVVTAAPFAPIAVAPSNLNCTSFNANWGGSVGAIAYYLDVSTSATFANFFSTYNNLNVGNVTTYQITGLTQGITYYYRVRAASGCTTSPNSNTESATIAAPSSPAALPATNVACVSFNANWASVSGATTYIIDVSTSGTFGSFVTGFNGFNTNGNVTTYNITAPEIVQGGTYFYRVRAVNGCATSGNSNLVSITTAQVNAPIAVAATDIACTVFNANWTPVAGVTGYFLDVSTSASFAAGAFVSGYNNLNVGNVLTYNVTGLTLNTTYYYRIRASSACATSTNSNTIVAATNAPPAPNATNATNVTCTSMNANWSAVSGVIGYYLDVSTDPNFGSFVPGFQNKSVGNVTTYNVTGLTGITVYFRVRSATACTQSINSNMVQVNPSAIAAPTAGNALNVACTVFDAQWSGVSGALSYEIDVSTSPSFANFVGIYNDLDVGNVTTLNVSGLTVNSIYYYRVRSKNACVTSPHSTTITVSTAAPAAPGIGTTTNITCDGFNVNWSSVQGAITYYLDVSTSTSFSTFVGVYNNFNVGSGNTYNVSGLNGITPPFYFRMRAASGCASGPSSAPVSVNPAALNAPGQLAATGVSCNSFTANWSAVSGALSYSLDVATNSGFGVGTILASYDNLTVVGATSYTVTGLTQNQTYYYRIRANNACISSLSNNVTAVTTAVPVAVTAIAANSITCGTFNARWNHASPLPLNYYLDVSTDQTFAGGFVTGYNNRLISGSPSLANNESVVGLTQNTIYYYRVRAENGCGIGPYSNIITAITTTPSAPGGLNVSASTCNSFTANWNAVGGATYDLDVSTDPNFGSSLSGYPANVSGTSRVVNGLSIGIIYYFRVRSVNLCGNSGYTGSLTFKIEDPAIPNPSLTNISCTSPPGYGVSWPLVSSATTYKVDVSADPSFGSFLGSYNNFNTGNVNGITVTGLVDPPGEYYIRVRSANACGTSGNSVVLTMITHAPAPPNTNGVLPSSITCNTFTAQWGASSGATAYLLDVSTSATFTTTLTGYNDLNVGVATSYNVPGLTTNGTYYYRVYARNSCGSLSAASGVVTVNLGLPTEPQSVVVNASTNSFTVTWAAPTSANATTYYMDVATTPTFNPGTFLSGYSNANVGAGFSTTVSGLATGYSYYVRLRSGNACGTSGNTAAVPAP
jgi:phosphodiesterase/alkaline phosphatase D-like protein